jgi:spore coat peptide assembly protein cotJB
MTRNDLLNRLTVLNFLAVDLQLFLNTHPDDVDAIEKYNSVIQEADELRLIYEKNFGPIYSFRSESNPKEFTWVDNPWPWEREFICK